MFSCCKVSKNLNSRRSLLVGNRLCSSSLSATSLPVSRIRAHKTLPNWPLPTKPKIRYLENCDADLSLILAQLLAQLRSINSQANMAGERSTWLLVWNHQCKTILVGWSFPCTGCIPSISYCVFSLSQILNKSPAISVLFAEKILNPCLSFSGNQTLLNISLQNN